MEHVQYVTSLVLVFIFTTILDQTWVPGFPAQQKPHYQPIQYCTYWTVLGSFNKWNILQLSHKGKSSEEMDKIRQVVLDSISNNMAALVQTDKYGAINTADTTTMGYYVIKFMS